VLRPDQAFIRRLSGGGADCGRVHADELSTPSFHYSAILYLNSAHDGAFSGGDLTFVERPSDGERSKDSTESSAGCGPLVRPAAGDAVMFSSGLENVHWVTPLLAGTRVNMPVFFTTQPPGARRAKWSGAAEGMAPNAEERARLIWRLAIKPGWATAAREADFALFLQSWAALLSSA
jgi:hypothetical protein